jgi:predicted MFS family arabinose efflux permease
VISVFAMFLGAMIGGPLVVEVDVAVPLALAACLQLAAVVVAHVNSAVEAA